MKTFRRKLATAVYTICMSSLALTVIILMGWVAIALVFGWLR